jgi:hypothetical protein
MEKDKPKIGLDDSLREAMISWVSDFLCLWEGAIMLPKPAAKIIVEEIFKAHACLNEDASRTGLYQLPDPESFFPDE